MGIEGGFRLLAHFSFGVFILDLQRLPPLSTDPDRCARAFVGNTIGQANGVYDKAIDLRFCDYTNEKINLKGKSLAAALMSGAIFDGADMTEVVMSKAYAVGASFKGNKQTPFTFVFSSLWLTRLVHMRIKS